MTAHNGPQAAQRPRDVRGRSPSRRFGSVENASLRDGDDVTIVIKSTGVMVGKE